jgi:signal transduction histidine kinase
MSLAKRIALSMALLLALIALPVGYFFYENMQRSLENELEGRLNTRLAWIEASLLAEEEEDGFNLEFMSQSEPEIAAEYWSITLGEDLMLWGRRTSKEAKHLTSLSKKKSFGEGEGEKLVDDDFVIYSKKHHRDRFRSFQRGHFDLTIRVFTSGLEMKKRLTALTQKLWLSGISLLIALTLLLTALINWQLAPLKRLSLRAEKIDINDLGESLPALGTSSECVALRDSINGMLKRLAQGMERERQFSSMAAHELRTPLAQLRTQIEVSLRKEREAGEYREALEEGLIDVQRLQDLIQGLLQLTRLNENKKIEGRPVSLSSLLNKLKKKSSDFVLKEQEEFASLLLLGDEELILSALFNVIENANRYGGEGDVLMTFEKQAEKLCIIVSDRGPGIKPEDAEKIFEALTRLDEARSIGAGTEGFGLGLTVARSIARALDGDLTFRQRKDGQSGAEFVFEFKIDQGDKS